MKRRTSETGRSGALNLLEQSIHVLRTAPAAAFLVYYVGTAPFVIALLFFWSDMTSSSVASDHLAGGAIGLTVAYIWMKTWQASFAAIIRSHVSREAPQTWTFTRLLQAISRQLAVQPSGLFLLPIAFVILLPFGWLFAFYQNVTVLGARSDERLAAFIVRSWREAKYAPIENHVLLSVLFLFGLFVWLNIAIAVLMAPQLLKILFGVETALTLRMESAFNTTLLAVVTGLAFLAIDPLLKTAYVLRCFYSESQQSGEDLRVALRKLAAGALVFMALGVATPGVAAAEAAAKPHTEVNAAELDEAISEVLQKAEYTWRSPRLKREINRESREFRLIERVRIWVRETAQAFADWIKKVLSRRSGKSGPSPFSFFSGSGLAYTLIALVAIVIGILLYFIWKMRFNARKAEATAQAAAAPPDLLDEFISAQELPEDGWLRLGVEMLEKGELRLALRAFYLASLVHLAERNLITLARFKSNRDYERELFRRSHALPELTRIFSDNVATFDRVWYGLHDVTAELLQEFRVNVERIKSS